VRVGDREQTFAELPNRDGIPVWFQCVNEEDVDFAAFGHIDFPHTFDYVGGEVTFRGWAIDQNVQVTVVEIVIDGDYVGQAQHGFPRSDVGDQYPNINNSELSGWQFTMDTRLLSNARHRLTVRTVDARGNRTEIGSVDFYVTNAGTNLTGASWKRR
jgi:3',5'-cyclic AMP phosphodiesterase CpdA